MSVQTKTTPESSLEINKTSVNASIDNSISASVSIGTNANKDTGISVGANCKTGTVASAGAGLDGKNVYTNISYSDTTEVHTTIDAKAGSHGVGGSGTVDAYAKTGTELEANLKVGVNGADVSAGASTGSYVGVDAESTPNMRGVSTTGGAGVTVGDHFEIGGGGQATYTNGKVSLGVSGDVSALIGIEVDASVTIDTKQIQHDAIVVAKETTKVVKQTENVAKKAGKDIKKTFKKIF